MNPRSVECCTPWWRVELERARRRRVWRQNALASLVAVGVLLTFVVGPLLHGGV